MGKEDCML